VTPGRRLVLAVAALCAVVIVAWGVALLVVLAVYIGAGPWTARVPMHRADGAPGVTATAGSAAGDSHVAKPPGRRRAGAGLGAVRGLTGTVGVTTTGAATATVLPAVDWPEVPDLTGRVPITTTAHFAVYPAQVGDALLIAFGRRWAPELEAILAADEARSGRTLTRTPLNVVFARAYDARCPARGLATPGMEHPQVMVFVRRETSDVQIRAVLAHEIAHQLSWSERFVGDGILSEGIANWIADDAMLAWQGFASWDDAVRTYLAEGAYISILADNALNPATGENCIARRDRVYNARAAFVGWLIAHYGIETVLAMPYREIPPPTPVASVIPVAPGAAPTPGTPMAGNPAATPEPMRVPDYVAATGAALPELERRWLTEIGEGDR
jgi:hypothetical protein